MSTEEQVRADLSHAVGAYCRALDADMTIAEFQRDVSFADRGSGAFIDIWTRPGRAKPTIAQVAARVTPSQTAAFKLDCRLDYALPYKTKKAVKELFEAIKTINPLLLGGIGTSFNEWAGSL